MHSSFSTFLGKLRLRSTKTPPEKPHTSTPISESPFVATKKTIKVLVLGDQHAGKSAFVSRYVDSDKTYSFVTTVGIDFKVKDVIIDGQERKLQIWDTVGQERYRTITQTYYKGAEGIFILYDVTNPQSFEAAKTQLNEVKKQKDLDNIPIMLIEECSKLSVMGGTRLVPEGQGQAFASEAGIKFSECSSCSGSQTITQAFESLLNAVPAK
ncbi:MAG: GTP-binding protein [Bdellovibrionota bacterium]